MHSNRLPCTVNPSCLQWISRHFTDTKHFFFHEKIHLCRTLWKIVGGGRAYFVTARLGDIQVRNFPCGTVPCVTGISQRASTGSSPLSSLSKMHKVGTSFHTKIQLSLRFRSWTGSFQDQNRLPVKINGFNQVAG